MRYEQPTSAKQAAGMLAKEKGAAFLLAGGTDLLVKLKMGMVEPDLVVDIKHIAKANEIQTTAKGFSVGAAVPGARLTEHTALKKAWPGVVEAANLIGSDQIQGRCTLAGNLCNASPAADSVPAMIAAGAKAVIVGAKTRRTIAVEKIAVGPGQTCLKKDELIESIALPKPGPRTGDAYLRFIPRTEMDIAVVGVAVCVTLARGRIKSARVALGARDARTGWKTPALWWQVDIAEPHARWALDQWGPRTRPQLSPPSRPGPRCKLLYFK